jgi:hypothetical protein
MPSGLVWHCPIRTLQVDETPTIWHHWARAKIGRQAVVNHQIKTLLISAFSNKAVYVNALEDILEEGERPVRVAYGANYERLRALKRTHDPSNLFRQNSNINPT